MFFHCYPVAMRGGFWVQLSNLIGLVVWVRSTAGCTVTHASTLKQADDGLSVEDLPEVRDIAADLGQRRFACVLILPPYSPDLSLIELAAATFQAHVRAPAARTINEFRETTGSICGHFTYGRMLELLPSPPDTGAIDRPLLWTAYLY
jgi:hypothetical protein